MNPSDFTQNVQNQYLGVYEYPPNMAQQPLPAKTNAGQVPIMQYVAQSILADHSSFLVEVTSISTTSSPPREWPRWASGELLLIFSMLDYLIFIHCSVDTSTPTVFTRLLS